MATREEIIKRLDNKETDFSDEDLSILDLSGLDFTGCNLHGCNLKESIFIKSKVNDVCLSFSNLEKTRFEDTEMNNIDLYKAVTTDIVLIKSIITEDTILKDLNEAIAK